MTLRSHWLFYIVAVSALFVSSAKAGNAVLDWNEQALNATRLSRTPPPMSSLCLATLHASIFDAVNGITRTHKGWYVNDPAPAGADVDAAIASAGYTVVRTLWAGANPRNIEIAYEKALAAIPDGQAKTDGLAWGKSVAQKILAYRASCGFDKPIPGQYASNEPGKWRETPPGFRPATTPFWAKVTPFVMTSGSQFRAPPPAAIDSKEYAADLANVMKVGARDDYQRTEYETLSAAFWSDDLGTCTPPGHWNIIAQDLARRYQLSTFETARLFALLNLTEADACISCWDSKFFYSVWRPETALRELDAKLNPHLTAKPEWIPMMTSPSFPSYTSGHSTFSAGAARVLERFFGTDDIEFTVTSDGLPGAVRTFKSLSACRDEVGMSRVFGGIHTMEDNIAGQNVGRQVADWVMDQALQPLAPATQVATK